MPTRGPEERVSKERLLLEVFVHPDPALFASEIEPEVPITRQRINERLDKLEDEGLVYSKHASGRRIWWMTQSGREFVAEAAREAISEIN